MLMVLGNWIYTGVITCVSGNALLRLLHKCFHVEKKEAGLFYSLFSGILFTTWYALVWSLFGKVGLLANLLLVAFCCVYAFLFRRQIKKDLFPTWKGKLPVLFAVLVILAFALCSAGPCKLIDTDWYHAQTIRWIEEFGCVRGVANLFYSLAFNSAQHYFDALFSMKCYIGQSMHATGGYFGLLIFMHGFSRVLHFKEHDRHLADALAVGEMIYAVIVTAFFADPYTDTLPNGLVLFILTEWLALAERREKEVFSYAYLCLFGVFATVVKSSVVMVVLLVIYPAYLLIKERAWKKITGYLLTGLCIAIPFLLTNIRISGYLVYLASGLDFFAVSWKIDNSIVRYSVDSMIHDARNAAAPMEEVLHQGLSWLPGWFNRESLSHRVLYLGVTGILLYDFVGMLRQLFGRKKPEMVLLLPRLVVYTGLVYWLLTIPQVKYCWAFLLFPLTVIPALYLEQSKGNRLPVRMISVLAAGLLLIFLGGYGLRTLKYVKDAIPRYLVKEADYELHTMKEMKINNLPFYVREENGDIVCGYYVFPYLDDEERAKNLLTGTTLGDGFQLKLESFP